MRTNIILTKFHRVCSFYSWKRP